MVSVTVFIFVCGHLSLWKDVPCNHIYSIILDVCNTAKWIVIRILPDDNFSWLWWWTWPRFHIRISLCRRGQQTWRGLSSLSGCHPCSGRRTKSWSGKEQAFSRLGEEENHKTIVQSSRICDFSCFFSLMGGVLTKVIQTWRRSCGGSKSASKVEDGND